MAVATSSLRTHCLSPSRARTPIDAAIGPARYAKMFPELQAFEADEAFLYAIGRAGGRRLVLRYGRYLFLTPVRMDRAEVFFTRHGAKIVIAARFIDGLRQLNGVIAGVTAMPWRRFLTYNAIGAALWVGLWTTLGYLAGNHIVAVYDTVHRYQWYALAALTACAAGYAAVHVSRRRRAARPQ